MAGACQDSNTTDMVLVLKQSMGGVEGKVRSTGFTKGEIKDTGKRPLI